MSRLTKDSRIDTREARARLKQRQQPYRRQIHPGLAIGYRKGKRGGVWVVRKLISKDQYTFDRLSFADDHQNANDVDVLSYAQAHRKALEFSSAEIQGPYTVGEATRDYLDWFKAHKKSLYTTDKRISTRILPQFEKRQLDSLTTAELTRWHYDLATHRCGKTKPTLVGDADVLRKRKASANRTLTVFKAILNRAWRNGKVKDNAQWRRVKPFENVDEARKIFLQEDQCRRLINAAQGDFREYVRALLYTGARPGKELEHIRVRDFDAATGTIHIPDGKTGARDVFLTDEAVEFFSRLTTGRHSDDYLLVKADGKRWGTSHHARPMQGAAKAAKLPAETNAYALRHTYISLALKNGAPMQVVAENTGTSVRMIERHYGKFLNADRRRMFNQAMPSFGLEQDNVVTLNRH